MRGSGILKVVFPAQAEFELKERMNYELFLL